MNPLKHLLIYALTSLPEGIPHLGAAIGSEVHITEYVSNKVKEWSSNLTIPSKIAKAQPHAAFAALTNWLLNKWTHLSWVQT